jgi:hypothetical protein
MVDLSGFCEQLLQYGRVTNLDCDRFSPLLSRPRFAVVALVILQKVGA